MNLRKPPESPTTIEVEGLADILRRRRWLLSSLLAGLPIVGAIALFEQAVVVTIVWAIVSFGLVVWHLLARCPRCHEFFNWSPSRSHRFAAACLHCGLELNAAKVREDDVAR